LLYIPLFLLHFNWVKPGVPSRWYLPRVDVSPQAEEGESPEGENVANGIPSYPAGVLSRRDPKLWSAILYPILYFIVVLPLSVVRFINFHRPNRRRPIETFIVINIYTLSGVFNALLYRLTRADFFIGPPRTKPQPPPIRKDRSRTELGVASESYVLSSF